jgi:hypothetical protein
MFHGLVGINIFWFWFFWFWLNVVPHSYLKSIAPWHVMGRPLRNSSDIIGNPHVNLLDLHHWIGRFDSRGCQELPFYFYFTMYCKLFSVISLSFRLSVCLPVCLSVCLSVCLPVMPVSLSLSVYLSVSLSVCQPVVYLVEVTEVTELQ